VAGRGEEMCGRGYKLVDRSVVYCTVLEHSAILSVGFATSKAKRSRRGTSSLRWTSIPV